jgi:low affinity Fe/Cu permease
MKNILTQVAVISFALLTLASCQKDEKEIDRQMERLFRANIKEVWNKSCVTLKMTKEGETQYFVDAILSDSTRLQAVMTGTPEGETKIVETLNSVTARLITENVGQFCKDLVLKKVDSVMYQGTATLRTGENLKVMVHPEKGWYPENDTASLSTIMKYQLKRDNNYQNIVVSLENVTPYEYIATVTADGNTNKLRVFHLGTEFKYDLIGADKPTTATNTK